MSNSPVTCAAVVVEPAISDQQLHILKHTLGISQAGHAYRNFFEPGDKYAADCEALVGLGLMLSSRRSWLPGPVYRCTDAGKQFALSH